MISPQKQSIFQFNVKVKGPLSASLGLLISQPGASLLPPSGPLSFSPNINSKYPSDLRHSVTHTELISEVIYNALSCSPTRRKTYSVSAILSSGHFIQEIIMFKVQMSD